MAHWITDANSKRIKVAGNYSLKERQAFLMAHPIGSYYISEDSTDPAELYGGGWEKVEGRFLLGSSASYPVGQELGSADAVVVSHTHGFNSGGVALTMYSSGSETSSGFDSGSYWGGVRKQTSEIAANGVSGTGKNMPPYRATNIWYRYQ